MLKLSFITKAHLSLLWFLALLSVPLWASDNVKAGATDANTNDSTLVQDESSLFNRADKDTMQDKALVQDLYSDTKVDFKQSEKTAENESATKNEQVAKNENLTRNQPPARDGIKNDFLKAPNNTSSLSSSPRSVTVDMMTFYIGAFGVIALIIILCIWLKKFKFVLNPRFKDFEVLRVLSVGPKERVVLLKAGAEQIVIGVTAHQVNLICKLDSPLNDSLTDAQNQNVNAGKSFAQSLADILMHKDSKACSEDFDTENSSNPQSSNPGNTSKNNIKE